MRGLLRRRNLRDTDSINRKHAPKSPPSGRSSTFKKLTPLLATAITTGILLTAPKTLRADEGQKNQPEKIENDAGVNETEAYYEKYPFLKRHPTCSNLNETLEDRDISRILARAYAKKLTVSDVIREEIFSNLLQLMDLVAGCDELKRVEYLLDLGADPNLEGVFTEALIWGELEITNLLIEKGADLHITAGWGNSINLAAMGGKSGHCKETRFSWC